MICSPTLYIFLVLGIDKIDETLFFLMPKLKDIGWYAPLSSPLVHLSYPLLALITGSGLSTLQNVLDKVDLELSYSLIPHFRCSKGKYSLYLISHTQLSF
jgi:hypothetical protein